MNAADKNKAEDLLKEFKGDAYAFGDGALKEVGPYASKLGNKVAIVADTYLKGAEALEAIQASLNDAGVAVVDVLDGARPNAPREDLYRLAFQVTRADLDGVVAAGGGSTIDAAKASLALKLYGGEIDDYFGTGQVTEKSGGEQIPLVAVQTASSSGAHLTKYSNITDLSTGQKKLIVDESIVPRASVYQYDVSKSMPPNFTKDGGLDGVAHSWEVWMGATGKPYFEKVSEVAYLSIKLVVDNLPAAVADGSDMEARYALGLGTDLGGYSIMLGGTNGGHLGSFSLVDLLAHGRGCAVLNPYYTVLFSDAIQEQLKMLAPVYETAGLIEGSAGLSGRALGEAVAEGMIAFSKSIEFPVTLKEAGATEDRIDRMVQAAKNPQLKMKLQNMPTPMDADAGDVDSLMRPTLEAAYSGDLSLIP
jgi:alcohol dehydrogenase